MLRIFVRLVSTSRRNQTALTNMGLSTLLLDATLPPRNNAHTMSSSKSSSSLRLRVEADLNGSEDSASTRSALPPQHRDLLVQILRQLYAATGIPDKDGRKLLVHLATAPPQLHDDAQAQEDSRDRVLDLLLDVAHTSQQPNSVLFSMAEHGHASLAFSTLRRPFPPGPTSRGFTFSTTFSIERIEPDLPIELLTLFDAQRSFHVQLSIEPGTGLFNYTTSLMASSPPTRFNNAVFVTGRQYHLVFVHLHPRGGAQMSPARLFVNGELVEEKLAPWPALARAVGHGSHASASIT